LGWRPEPGELGPKIRKPTLIMTSSQGGNEGGQGDTITRPPNHYRGAKWLQGAPKNTKMSKVLPSIQYIYIRKTSFEHGVVELASCPGRHLTSLRPCVSHKKPKPQN